METNKRYSLEELVAIDLAKEIEAAELRIALAKEDLVRLRKAAGALLSPRSEDVKSMNPTRLRNAIQWELRDDVDNSREAKLYGLCETTERHGFLTEESK